MENNEIMPTLFYKLYTYVHSPRAVIQQSIKRQLLLPPNLGRILVMIKQ